MAAASSGSVITPVELQCIVDYHAGRGYFSHVQSVCEEYLSEKGQNDAVMFWHAFALSMQPGKQTEAIRAFEPLQGRPEVNLAVTAALISTHNNAKRKDRQALAKLKEDLKTYTAQSGDAELVFASRYFWHADRVKQARKCLDKVLSKSQTNATALAIYGWLNIQSGQEKLERKAPSFFQISANLSPDQKNISALLGMAAYHEKERSYAEAMDALNRVIVAYPFFTPAVTEKARILLSMGKWEESLECAGRVLQDEPNNIDSLRIVVVYVLVRESNSRAAEQRISQLGQAIAQTEPDNAGLYFQTAQLCARYAQRQRNILRLSIQFVEKACALDPGNSSYMTEHGYQLLLFGDLTKAMAAYGQASQLDESNVEAPAGRIRVKVRQGALKQAERELEFLSAQDAGGTAGSEDLLFLQALIAWHGQRNQARAVQYLEEAARLHTQNAESVPPGLAFFLTYNPDFIMEVVSEYMLHLGTAPRQSSEPESPLLNRAVGLLQQLTHTIPGLFNAHFLLAKCLYIDNRLDDADRVLNVCIAHDSGFAEAYLLRSQIAVAKGQNGSAEEALDRALSLSFDVRDSPIFQLLKAKLLKARGHLRESLNGLREAMSIAGVTREDPQHPIPLQDRLNLFLQFVELLADAKNFQEAKQVLQAAHVEFKDAAEGKRLVLAESQLALARGDTKGALAVLRQVPEESPYYTQAKMDMANIYLKHQRNRKLYAACYQELAYSSQSVHKYSLLGEAFLHIQEPDKAVEAFEQALQLQPNDANLASRIGKALVTTHDYNRAIKYYEQAIQNANSSMSAGLERDLAELHLQLTQYDLAARTIEKALQRRQTEQKEEVPPVFAAQERVKNFALLAKIHDASDNVSAMEHALLQAQEQQLAVLKEARAQGDMTVLEQQRAAAAGVCFQLAQYYNSRAHPHAPAKAQSYYQEALKYMEHHTESLLALARLQLAQGNLEGADNFCERLLKLDENNIDATMIRADVLLRKGEHQFALHYFQNLLERSPNQYDALAKLLSLMRRAGKLPEAAQFVELARNSSERAPFDHGFHFCVGLLKRYTNDPSGAIEEFAQARNDGKWGQHALENMIEIYINPDNAALFNESAEAKGNNEDRLRDAKLLLGEYAALVGNTPKYRLLEAYAAMASGRKDRIEEGFQACLLLQKADKDYVPATLGLANATRLLKSDAQAKNHLKRITAAMTKREKYNAEYEEEYEQAALMLADLFIKKGKYDEALKLTERVKKSNQSNAKAWEQMGIIKEKSLAYREAADCYEKAWVLLGESSPHVGFRLSFNYLKAKKHLDAIDICHKVLKINPSYPKIRKEVLERARMQLRP